MVDTEASNLPALEFFKKKGFGNPEEQIYLTLNVKTYQEKPRQRTRLPTKAEEWQRNLRQPRMSSPRG